MYNSHYFYKTCTVVQHHANFIKHTDNSLTWPDHHVASSYDCPSQNCNILTNILLSYRAVIEQALLSS